MYCHHVCHRRQAQRVHEADCGECREDHHPQTRYSDSLDRAPQVLAMTPSHIRADEQLSENAAPEQVSSYLESLDALWDFANELHFVS